MANNNKKSIKIGSLQLSWSGFVFLSVLNVSIALIIANVIMWKTGFWCHYSILTLLYFAVFFKAIASRETKKFFAIIRNGLFLLHIVMAFVFLINFWVKTSDARTEAWTYIIFLFKWFFPISLLVIGVITMLAFALRQIRISRAYLMVLAFFPQSILVFNLAMSSLFELCIASRVINIISFVFYFTIVVGFFLIYIGRLIYQWIRAK